MSTQATVASGFMPAARQGISRHRILLIAGYVLMIALITGLFSYGFHYYTANALERPFSEQHRLLKPSGKIGVKLGFLGFAMFAVIFLYPLRKRWAWLSRIGTTKNWLDFHVLLGVSAPFVIALHSSFKFAGIAGMAFWIMLAVSLSGVVGRYLYNQIPRRLNAAEISRKELQDFRQQLSERLATQSVLRQADIHRALRLPSQEKVDGLPAVIALIYMFCLDLLRPFRIAGLRRSVIPFTEKLTTCCGFLKTRHRNLEQAITVAQEEAAFSKRILFLARSQQIFHLWHVVHKPFSYTFALLALFHVGLVLMMGFF
jgi:hypothetical protein